MIINESKIRKIIREVLNKTLMKEEQPIPSVLSSPEDRLEGLPGDWTYAIVGNVDGYYRIMHRRLNDWIKGSYTVEDWLEIEEELTPEDVRDVRMQVMSGDSNVGDRFLLSDISNIEGESVYQDHPLVQQVIDWFVRSWEEHTRAIRDDFLDTELAAVTREWFAEQRQRVGAEVEEVTDEPVETDEEEDEQNWPSPTPSGDIENISALFVGDSQTAQYGGSNKYVDVIESRYPNMYVTNYAKSSKKLKAILRQLKKGVSTGAEGDPYDVITIMGGGNNWGDTNPPYHLYDEMYRLAKSHGSIVIAITNPTKNNKLPQSRSKVETNEKLADYVRTNADSMVDIVIDANSDLQNKSYFKGDKVHLNSDGHEYLAQMWIDAVNNKLRNKETVG